MVCGLSPLRRQGSTALAYGFLPAQSLPSCRWGNDNSPLNLMAVRVTVGYLTTQQEHGAQPLQALFLFKAGQLGKLCCTRL